VSSAEPNEIGRLFKHFQMYFLSSISLCPYFDYQAVASMLCFLTSDAARSVNDVAVFGR